MAKIDPLIAIGVPTWGKVSTRWARAYRHLGGPLGSVTLELEVVGRPIAEARNTLMAQSIAANADFLFMLGDDVLCPGDGLAQLLQRLWDNPDVHLATGVYWTKGFPTQPYLWRGMQRGPYLDWKCGEWFEVDYAGCDALLIRLSPEIKALGPEWFSTTWPWSPEDEAPNLLNTEDFFFYTKARQAGLKLWCDSAVQCVHEDRQTGMQFCLQAGMPQAGGQLPSLPEGKLDPDGKVVIADIGCGTEHPFFGHADAVKIVRFDGNEKVKPDFRCDIRNLPVADNCFDLVHSRHVLEHFGRADAVRVLTEWIRVLRVGGELRLSVPNLLYAMDWIRRMDDGETSPDPYPWWQLYGRQDDERDVHKNGFTPKKLRQLLETVGTLEQIEVEEGDDGCNLYARAIKRALPTPFTLTTAWEEIREQTGEAVPGLRHDDSDSAPSRVAPEQPAPEGLAAPSIPHSTAVEWSVANAIRDSEV